MDTLENATEESKMEALKSQIKFSQDSLKMSFFLTFVTIIAILIFIVYSWKQNVIDLAKSYRADATLLFFVSGLFSMMYRGTGYFSQVHFPVIQDEGTAKRWKYARTIFGVCSCAFILAGLTVIYFGITA